MRLEELFSGWMELPARYRGISVTGVSCDSRRVAPGDVFVAVSGETVDGHRFIEGAVASGAVAIVGERRPSDVSLPEERRIPYVRVASAREALGRLSDLFWRRPSQEIAVVGITGTKGKTTTAWVLDSILARCGSRPALFGTVENRFGARSTVAVQTTPSALDLHSCMREHADLGGTHAVLEVSSHAIAQKRTQNVRFAAAIFTNVAPEHLDYHKTFESYRETKVSWFDGLDPGAFAILSRDDPASWRIAQRTPARVVWYGGGPEDGIENLRVTPEGLSFRWKGRAVESRLLGYHNFLNLIAAMSAAECLGLDPSRIVSSAASAVAPPGRLENVAPDRDFRVIVDYAHTDGSLEAVLRTLRTVTPGRIITVFGCGGDRDRAKRPRMGAVAESGSDHVIITSDNPRSENPAKIIADIGAGLERREAAEIVEDRREAIGLAVRMARPGDTVLIAGKGHETYQDLGGKRISFDDRAIAREFLAEPLPGCAL